MSLFRSIAIEGLPGSGKSYLAEKLAEKCASQEQLVIGQAKSEPFSTGELQEEISILLKRFQEHKDRQQYDLFGHISIWDYFIHKSQIYSLLRLNDSEFDLFKKIVKALHVDKIRYDLCIYLQNSTEKIVQQLELKSKNQSDPYSADFYSRLNNLMNDFFFHYQEPLLIINTNSIDIFNDPEKCEYIIDEVLSFKGHSRTIVIR